MQWPLGPEVRRSESTGGAMLYDASRVSNFTPAWFDPDFWAGRGAIEGDALGRGTVYFVRADERRYVLRHYRRGGLFAPLLRDRYRWRGADATRPFREWQLMYHLRRAGLPVPAPVAARFRRFGSMYTGDLLTERLIGMEPLSAHLRRGAVPLATWIEIGRCIRRFHDLGVCHADLNAHNVLFDESCVIHLIDFDRGRLRKPGLWCDGNIVRLRRSVEKIAYGLPSGHFSESDWHALIDGYCEARK